MGRGKRSQRRAGLGLVSAPRPGLRDLIEEVAYEPGTDWTQERLEDAVERFVAAVAVAHPVPEGTPPFRVLGTSGMTGFTAPRHTGEIFELHLSRGGDWRQLVASFAGYVALYVLSREERERVFAALKETARFAAHQAQHSWRDEEASLVDLWQPSYCRFVLLKAGVDPELPFEPGFTDSDFAPLGRAFEEVFAALRLSQVKTTMGSRGRLGPLAERLS